MSREIILPYGRSELRASWSGGLAALRARNARPARDPAAVAKAALGRPAGSPPLAGAARGAADCAIVVSDPTRETALRALLPPVFESLREAGIAPRKTSIIVAYGNHARAPDSRIRRTLGRLPRGVSLVHHDSGTPAGLVALGRLPSGEVLRVNRAAARAGLLVVTGAITYHYHAGFTGGRKAILPGIAARENVLANHARTLDEGSPGGRSDRCAPGRLAGNPVHEEMEAAARLLMRKLPRPPFLVNSVLSEEGGLAAVFAGDVFEAFARGAKYVDDRFRAGVARPFDVAFASAGGFPRDVTFYQAHKAFDHAARAVADGGVVVLAAECPEGPGKGFLEWFGYQGYDEHLAALKRDFAVPGQTSLALRQKLARVRGVLVSRMRPADVRRMGLLPAPGLGEAVEAARALLLSRKAPRACIIPHASVVLPCPRGGKVRA